MWNFTGGGCAAGCSTMRELTTRRMFVPRSSAMRQQSARLGAFPADDKEFDTKVRRIEAISKYLLSYLHRESVNRINDRRLVMYTLCLSIYRTSVWRAAMYVHRRGAIK